MGSDHAEIGTPALSTCPLSKVQSVIRFKDPKETLIGAVVAAVLGLHNVVVRRAKLNRLKEQSMLLPGEEAVWRRKNLPGNELMVVSYEEASTCYHNFFTFARQRFADLRPLLPPFISHSSSSHPPISHLFHYLPSPQQNPCLGTRTGDGFSWESYELTARRASDFGAGLVYLGLKPGDRFGIYSVNNAEWVLAELGGYCYGLVNVSLYATLGQEAVNHVVNHSEMVAVVCSVETLSLLFKILPSSPACKTVIYMQGGGQSPSDAVRQAAEEAGVHSTTLSSLFKALPSAPAVKTVIYMQGGGQGPSDATLSSLFKALPSAPAVKTVIYMQGGGQAPSDADRQTAEDAGVKLIPFSQVEEWGAQNPQEHTPPKPEDLAVLMYTSGTTVSGNGTTVSGNGTTVTSNGTTVSGDGTTVSGNGTTVSGDGTTVSGDGTTVSGNGTTVSGDGTTVSGNGTTVSGNGTTVSGDGTTVSGDGTTVSGDGTTASGDGTTVSGDGTTVSGNGTTVTGDGTTASGDGTTEHIPPKAEDLAVLMYTSGTTVSGIGTTVSGNGTTVSGDGTTASGDGTTEHIPPKAEDLAVLMYTSGTTRACTELMHTSGTTVSAHRGAGALELGVAGRRAEWHWHHGDPKGVMLTHRNIIANTTSCLAGDPKGVMLTHRNIIANTTSCPAGDPKGVMLTHRNIIANTTSCPAVLGTSGVTLGSGDRYLSYLPLAHIFERAALASMYMQVGGLQCLYMQGVAVGLFSGKGVAVGFYSGKVESLLEDMGALKPTVLFGVPRLFNRRVHDKGVAVGFYSGKVKSLLEDMGALKPTVLLGVPRVFNKVHDKGVAVGFYSGKVESLLEDMGALKPTVLFGVPRVFNKVHDKVLQQVDAGSALKRFLFNSAIGESAKVLKAGGAFKSLPLWDTLIFKKDGAGGGTERVFNKVHDKVLQQVDAGSALKRFLFNSAIRESAKVLKAGGAFKSLPLWDTLIFKKVQARVGGCCRVILSGGAPISAATQQFLAIAFGCPALQGYGLSETSAAGTITALEDPNTGHVGPPQPSVDMKLAPVPEMEYLPTDKPKPRGEICFRGASVMVGYYKQEEMTAEVIDSDGWFHTGDIGQVSATGDVCGYVLGTSSVGALFMDLMCALFMCVAGWCEQVNEDGTLTIIDRKKNIFKLAQGEYVAAEKLEVLYAGAAVVGQIFVYGDSFKSSLVAVVVPEKDVLSDWATSSGALSADEASTASLADLCALPGAKEYVLDELVKRAKATSMKGFEVVRGVTLEAEAFTTDNDLMTPSFKLKRPKLKAKYQAAIDELYTTLT
ncbi:unnamed protein product [Closterium sp. NIES-64]|nr:unnamed protein product [Closterium sp. NIES-64]